MKKSERVTRREVQTRIDLAWHDVLEANGLLVSSDLIKRILKPAKRSPEIPVALGVKIGWGILISNMGRSIAPQIKTRKQLESTLQQIHEVGEQLPTLLRKATKMTLSTFRRRGGPGRTPKLSAKEAAQVCDQVAVFIRQKNTVKQALQKTADLTPTLLGKKVGARTIQKAWDKRDEFTSG